MSAIVFALAIFTSIHAGIQLTVREKQKTIELCCPLFFQARVFYYDLAVYIYIYILYIHKWLNRKKTNTLIEIIRFVISKRVILLYGYIFGVP